MNRSLSRSVLYLAVIVVALGAPGCSKPQPKNPTVADVNGEAIKMAELREFLGVRGGMTPVAGVPAEQRKQALDRLIAGRLLAQDARALGLDNTDDFRDAVKGSGQNAMITALFRKEVASRAKDPKEEIQAEAKKMMASDNTLSKEQADARASRLVSDREIRKVEEELIAAAQKEFPSEIRQEMLDRIGKGETVPDGAVLATAAGDNVTYGDVKKALQSMRTGMPGGQDVARNPVVVSRLLSRELTGKSLAAYAKKQGIEGSEWHTRTRDDIERAILIDLLAERVMKGRAEVTDKEIENAYREHADMFVQHGDKIPLKRVKEQLRGFLQNEKLKSALNAYIEELKKKAKITVDEKALGEV